jgi:hypothetical protein
VLLPDRNCDPASSAHFQVSVMTNLRSDVRLNFSPAVVAQVLRCKFCRLGCDQEVRRHRRASSSAPATNNSVTLDGSGTPLTTTLSSAQYSYAGDFNALAQFLRCKYCTVVI